MEPYLQVQVERRSANPGRRATDDRSSLRESPTGARIIELPRITDPRGNLTAIEGDTHVPFAIGRVYYVYDVPGGTDRGGHAHIDLQQLVVAVSGSFDVVVDDGVHRDRFHLNRSYYGLYVPRMVWRELDNFSSASVCLVLASEAYRESDYLRDYDDYRVARGLAA